MVPKSKVSKKRVKSGKRVSERRKKEEMERGQVWSVDVLLGVVIFISVILIFYVTINAKQKQGLTDLESEVADLRIELEQNHEVGFIVSDEVDENKLMAFSNNVTFDYDELKRKLGIKGEFCLYFEDADGNIILIAGNKTSIGNPAINITPTIPCGTEWAVS